MLVGGKEQTSVNDVTGEKAAASGLRPGALVHTINGAPTLLLTHERTMELLRAGVKAWKAGGQLALEFRQETAAD